MLLKNEVASSICEFDVNKKIVAIYLVDLLIIHNWRVVRRLKEDLPGNIQKDYIAPLPGFDAQRFPFLLCSGYDYFSLINVRDYHKQEIILASTPSVGSQQAFFF